MANSTNWILAYLRKIRDVPSINSYLLQEESKSSESVWGEKKEPTIQMIPGPDWMSDCLVRGPDLPLQL